MGLIQRIFSRKEDRASFKDPTLFPEWAWFWESRNSAGQVVNSQTAMKQAVVYACVKVIAESIASLPIKLYMRKPSGRKLAETHPLFNILHVSPNPQQTAFEYWEMKMAHALLNGNAYSYIETDGGGVITGLWPLMPRGVTVKTEEGSKGKKMITGFEYRVPNHDMVLFKPEEIWHFKDLSDDGILGLSRISQSSNTIGEGMAKDEYSGGFFKNSAQPDGILEYPGRLSEDALKKMRESWDDVHGGAKNSHKTAVLQGGLQWKQITINAKDAQLIESRNFTVSDIARIFRVPTILINGAGDNDKSNTFASAEQQMLSFVTHTLRPWTIRLEQSISKSLLTTQEQKKLYAEFNMDAMLRGDTKSRYEAYKIGREWGWLNADEIRQKENLDPLPDGKGEIYLQPMNMQEAGTEPEPEETEPDEPNLDENPDEGDTDE